MKNKKIKKGYSLLIGLVVLAAFLAFVLILATIFWGELVSATAIFQSTKAIYIADAGIERTLVYRNTPSAIPFAECICPSFCSLSETKGSFCYELRQNGEGDCDAEYFCIKVIGDFGHSRRSIEVKY